MAEKKEIVVYPLRLPKTLYERIGDLARSEHRTKADQMRFVLDMATRPKAKVA